MFFQTQNGQAAPAASFNQGLTEVSTQSLQATGTESKKKYWIVLIFVALAAFVFSPKESKKSYRKSYKR